MSRVTELVELVLDLVELLNDAAGTAYATTRSDPPETLSVRSEAFRRLVAGASYRTLGEAPSQTTLASALPTLEAIAFEGPEYEVHLRLAHASDRVLVDLADPERHVVAITSSGWSIEPASREVKFLRSPGMMPLPFPLPGGDLIELARFLNLPDDDAFMLTIGFLVECLREPGPHPVLSITGEPGSGKSFTARVIRDLIDPNVAPLRSPPTDERDLLITARGSWLPTFDNVSHLDGALSDAFCRLSSGGAFATRTLFTNEGETILAACRPVVIASVGEVVTAGDLADRSILTTLPTVGEGDRVPEHELLARFEGARRRLTGALYEAVAAALARRERDHARAVQLPRLADFALWVEAAAPALGWEPGTFITAYQANREESQGTVIESSPIARFLPGVFQGTAAELLDRARELAGPEAARSRGWPATPRGLGGVLRRIAPALRAQGMEITFTRAGHERTRVITIQPTNPAPMSEGTQGPKSNVRTIHVLPAAKMPSERSPASDA